MGIKEQLMNESNRIWRLFKPYLKDEPLSDKEWAEIRKIGDTEKYELPEGDISDPKICTDPSYWKWAIQFFSVNYILLMMKTIEKWQRGLPVKEDD